MSIIDTIFRLKFSQITNNGGLNLENKTINRKKKKEKK
jgi:hypothetical protein